MLPNANTMPSMICSKTVSSFPRMFADLYYFVIDGLVTGSTEFLFRRKMQVIHEGRPIRRRRFWKRLSERKGSKPRTRELERASS